MISGQIFFLSYGQQLTKGIQNSGHLSNDACVRYRVYCRHSGSYIKNDGSLKNSISVIIINILYFNNL